MDLVKQYDIYWIDLDPTMGKEINKIRPALILSPLETNKYFSTVVIAPITSTIRNLPTRINLVLKKKRGQIILDQIRAVDKKRLKGKIDTLELDLILEVKELLKKFLID